MGSQQPTASPSGSYGSGVPTCLSRDGLWLWSGTRWVPTPYVRSDGQWWLGDHWAPGVHLSDDGMWRWSDSGWVPAALLSPDRLWVWSGLEWFRLPAPGRGPWRALGWVALGLAFFSVYAAPMLVMGIADAQVAGVGTGVEDLVMLAFTLPGAVLGSVVAGRSRKSDLTARGLGLAAVGISLGSSAFLALLLLA